jgi:hypothetical protein
MSASSRSLTLATVLAISGTMLAAPGCIIVSDDDDSVDGIIEIANDSEFDIVDVSLAPIDSSDWGPNQVPEGIFPGESVEIGVECDFYDLRLIDSDDFQCIVPDIDLCLRDAFVSYDGVDCLLENATGETLKKGTKTQLTPAEAAARKSESAKAAPADVL